MKLDPDHYLTQPMDNQEAAHARRIAVTDANVAACAQAIRDLDRVTPRPLTAEDQARAVLTFLANAGTQRPGTQDAPPATATLKPGSLK